MSLVMSSLSAPQTCRLCADLDPDLVATRKEPDSKRNSESSLAAANPFFFKKKYFSHIYLSSCRPI